MSDDLPIAVVRIGPGGTIAQLNTRAERLLGCSSQACIGKAWGEVLRLHDTAGRLVHNSNDPFESTNNVASGSPERDYLLTRVDGSQVAVTMSTSYKFDDHKLVEVVAVLRDASPGRRRELTAYELIATLAHDLRSPLTSIKGFSATMRQRWDRLTDEQKLHMLATMDHDSERMNRLLADLLTFTRLESSRLELRHERVDLPAVVRSIGESVARGGSSHEISFEFASNVPKILGDQAKLEQVVQNLLENAVRHADPGAVIVSLQTEGNDVLLRVTDVGPGIDAHFAPFVFSKFFHRKTRRTAGGTGLGLYICRGIVEAHGGKIVIERSDPSGTVFLVSLPTEPNQE